jgi:hypothetical protein
MVKSKAVILITKKTKDLKRQNEKKLENIF